MSDNQRHDPRCLGCGNSVPLSVAAKLDPGTVCAVLRSKGWTEHPSSTATVAIFRHLDSKGQAMREVQVPLVREIVDFDEAMMIVARRVGEVEDLNTNAVLFTLQVCPPVTRCQADKIVAHRRRQCCLPVHHLGECFYLWTYEPERWCDPEWEHCAAGYGSQTPTPSIT